MRIECLAAASAMMLGCALTAAAAQPAQGTRRKAVEFRSYNLKPGSLEAFQRLVLQAVPMLRRHDIDVVAFGRSAHDGTSYYLVRAFADLEDRTRKEDAFYGSEEWRRGPREPVLALIESYTTVVLELDDAVVEGLRRRTE